MNESFRSWLYRMHQEANAERMHLNMEDISSTDYFKKYRWWLKREYKHQQKNK